MSIKTKSLLAGLVGTLILGTAQAAPITIIVGDDDGYGQGLADGANLPSLAIPQDNRSAAEAAATNGAQQTDFYSSNFNPLPEVFDVIFSLPSAISSATLTIDMGGFQADTFGPFAVAINGIDASSLLDFQDGAFATVVRTFDLAPWLASINALNSLTLTIDRDGSNDATSFDYFRLDAETVAVPEPGTLALLLLGLAGLWSSRRFAW